MECLIVIDMQNEFLSKTGNFSKNHIPNDILIKNVVDVIDKFNQLNKSIIFVRSEYDLVVGKSIPQDKFKVGTHCGSTPCCLHGSEGAEIHPDIACKIGNHKVITKKWFNAFRETNLDEILKEMQIKKIYFAGVKTNVCVFLTLEQAKQLGYDTVLIEDCTAATTIEKHNDTINRVNSL